MSKLQRYFIVLITSLFWFTSIVLVLAFYMWFSRSSINVALLFFNAGFAALAGAIYGLACALLSYLAPISGHPLQRLAIGASLGLLTALACNAVAASLNAPIKLVLLFEFVTLCKNYVAATLLMSLLGLATPRRLFFAISKHARAHA